MPVVKSSGKKINVAIDGFSSCGKSTLAKGMAKALGFGYIDSGAMYRAATLYLLRRGLVDKQGLDREGVLAALPDMAIDFVHRDGQNITRLNGEEVETLIRDIEVSNLVSIVSKVPEIRAKLRALQQAYAENGGVVMDGRDIGSVVLPDAELKIFMTADREARVQRRYKELISKGHDVSVEEVRENIAARDKLDTERSENPLIRTEDAKLLDNTHLTAKESLELALSWVKELLEPQD